MVLALPGRLRAADGDPVTRSHTARRDDAGIEPSQPQGPPHGAVDEAHRLGTEPLHELGASGVGLLGDLDDGPAHLRVADGQSRAGRQVLVGQVEVEVELGVVVGLAEFGVVPPKVSVRRCDFEGASSAI
mgnify:CR=1 FL=1